jgi:hypothetical protein
MFGGLTKTASRLALVAAAGTMMTGSAFAADLGGDCCADLEERVAELEATTARKGNRKVSLTISGQVNKTMNYWSDGSRSNVNTGYDNHNSSSRVGFTGNAKISPNYTAGYSMLFEWGDKARTSTFGQLQDIGSSRGVPNTALSSRVDDAFVRLRDSNVWVESNTLGRLTMGRLTSEAATGTIDLAGIGAAVGDDAGCNGGGLQFRGGAVATAANPGGLGKRIADYTPGCGGPWANRLQAIKYTSPTFAGFVFVAHVGGQNLKVEQSNIDSTLINQAQAGREWGAVLRYAGEFSGVRLAASAGYQVDEFNRELAGTPGAGNNGDNLIAGGAAYGAQGDYTSGRSKLINLALSMMHTPTGLFAQGEYTRGNFDVQRPDSLTTMRGARDMSRFHIQAGISQNWFGAGKTSLYGEYMRSNNWAYATAGYALSGAGCAPATIYTVACNLTTGATVSAASAATVLSSGDRISTWGLGINQAVDAAAMDLYINYRNHTLTDPNIAVAAPGPSAISVVTTGARIRF